MFDPSCIFDLSLSLALMNHPSGKISRKTGFTEYLKHFHEEFQQDVYEDDSQPFQHWFDRRQHIFSEAVTSWKSADSDVKKLFRDNATAKNLMANRERASLLAVKKENEIDEATQRKSIEQKQKKLFQVAFQSGLLHCDQHAPAEDQIGGLALEDERAQSSDEVAVVERCFANSSLTHDATGLLDNCNSSLCGLGDNEFAISQKLLEFAVSRKGFIQNSHSQFNTDHGSISEIVSELEIDERSSLDNGYMSCEQLLGRYCRTDIKDLAKYNNIVSMMQNVVRVLMSRRTVKCGQSFFLGMDVPWPVFLIRRESSPAEIKALLIYRVCFNPYEIDFIQCDVTRSLTVNDEAALEESFRLRLLFDRVVDSKIMLPSSESMRELAVWYSQQEGHDWNCQIFFDYDIEDKRPCTLLLTSRHEQAVTTTINRLSFESIIDEKSKQRKEAQGDDDSSIPPSISGLLKRIGAKENKKDNSDVKSKPVAKRVQQLPLLDDQPRNLSY